MSEQLISGTTILYWPGIRRDNILGRQGTIISDGVVQFGGTDCVRIRRDDGCTDYIALTHIKVPE